MCYVKFPSIIISCYWNEVKVYWKTNASSQWPIVWATSSYLNMGYCQCVILTHLPEQNESKSYFLWNCSAMNRKTSSTPIFEAADVSKNPIPNEDASAWPSIVETSPLESTVPSLRSLLQPTSTPIGFWLAPVKLAFTAVYHLLTDWNDSFEAIEYAQTITAASSY